MSELVRVTEPLGGIVEADLNLNVALGRRKSGLRDVRKQSEERTGASLDQTRLLVMAGDRCRSRTWETTECGGNTRVFLVPSESGSASITRPHF